MTDATCHAPEAERPHKVAYPPGCSCPHPKAKGCVKWKAQLIQDMGSSAEKPTTCECVCHTMEPSPWWWHDGYGKGRR